MPIPLQDRTADLSLSPETERDVARYLDQGGMLGVLAYTFVALSSASDGDVQDPAGVDHVLDSGDRELAANVATQLTLLFVASSLHDDAIDEHDSAKRFRNERVTVGDLLLADVLELAGELPADADVGATAASVREIARGQLAEEAVDPTVASRELAIERVEQRGSVWGSLVASLVDAGGDHPVAQLDRIESITADLLFVYTIFDDVADLSEDVRNGVSSVPLLLLADSEADRAVELERPPGSDGDSHAAAVTRTVLDSDVPEQLRELVASREAAIETTAEAFYEAGEYTPRAVAPAVDEALEWYCESACTTPPSATVSPAVRDDVRAQLSADPETRCAFVESMLRESPLPTAIFPDAATIVDSLPPEPLGDLTVRLVHVDALARETMPTDLDAALESLRRRVESDNS
ncbi:class 1 isoprenoid biosynthesis enzyme [Halobacteria archaeon AArc-dxtr1]|nr:class 1 isoprenoid biosynthesis enzyme [Halobacteria archaeon AArc-dxtr1]